MNEFPLAVRLVPYVGDPKGDVERFSAGIFAGTALHAAGQSEFAVADHFQFEEINFYVLEPRKLLHVVVKSLLAREFAWWTHDVKEHNIITTVPVLLRLIGSSYDGNLVLQVRYLFLVIGSQSRSQA